MTQQFRAGQIPEIAKVKDKVSLIKKIVNELFDKSFIPAPVIIDIEPK